MADTFPAPIGMTSRRTDKITRDRVQFDEGQSQRSTPSLNPISQVWNLVFNVKRLDDYNEIVDFYYDHITEAFEWTPPNETEPRLWTISAESPPEHGLAGFESYDISLQFIEEHDLV